MRQRLATIPRSTRSISTFRPQRLRVPGQGGQLTLASSGATWHKTSLAVGPAAIRFKSSMPEPAPSPVPETTAPSEFVEATDLSDFDLTTIPERIGYLKELGLDYGWGPSSIAQYFIEHLHVWGGMPWWAGIVATGLLFRGVLLPFALMASDQAARSHNAKPLTTPLREEMMRHLQQGNQLAGQQKRAELSEIHRAHGIKVWKTLVPLLQIPLGFGIFRATRGMTSLPLPAFMNESFFWVKDLTVADPLYILPMVTSFAMYLTFKKGGESGMMDFMKGPGQMILYVLPGMSFAFMAWQPAALQLYFATTGIFAFGQSTIMHNPWVRKFFRMTMPAGGPSVPSLDRTQSAGVERLQMRIAEEKRRAAEMKKQAQEEAPPASLTKVSSIDQWIQGKKKGFNQWSEDASKSMNKVLGKSATNADGSPVAGPRLSDAERRKAEEYEKERKSADAFAREERNYARRQAHMQALAAEREKAKASWQKQQEAAVNNRRRRK